VKPRIDGTGHISYLERPEAFNEAVLRFLDRVERGRSNPDIESSLRGEGVNRLDQGGKYHADRHE
jgi:hypothetical protein